MDSCVIFLLTFVVNYYSASSTICLIFLKDIIYLGCITLVFISISLLCFYWKYCMEGLRFGVYFICWYIKLVKNSFRFSNEVSKSFYVTVYLFWVTVPLFKYNIISLTVCLKILHTLKFIVSVLMSKLLSTSLYKPRVSFKL